MRRNSLFSAVHLVWEIQMNITIHTRHSAVPARLTEAKRPYRAFFQALSLGEIRRDNAVQRFPADSEAKNDRPSEH